MRPRTFIILLLIFLLLATATVCGGCWFPGADILFMLIIGWVLFLIRVGPQIHVRWDLLGSAIVFAGALVIGSHLFLRWLYSELRPPPKPEAAAGESANQIPTPPTALTPEHQGEQPDGQRTQVWKWQWTWAGFALVILMFVAGIATIGIVHQTTWLARSPEPIYRSTGERANRVRCSANLKTIGLALNLYADDNGGRYPDDFRPLVLKIDLNPECCVCPSSFEERAPGQTQQEISENLLKEHYCSYVYLGKGLSRPVAADRVVAYEQLKNHVEGMNVLYGDGHTEWVSGEAAETLLKQLEADRAENQRRPPTTAATRTK
jgi:prepilin-type processing-associated H-X9-DG protein